MLRSVLLMLACVCCVSCDGNTRPPPPVPAPPHAQAPVIFRLVSRDHVIAAHAGTDGPTYSVTTRSGEVLMAEATLDEIRVRDPVLHRFINTMQANGVWADVSSPLHFQQP